MVSEVNWDSVCVCWGGGVNLHDIKVICNVFFLKYQNQRSLMINFMKEALSKLGNK